MRSTARNPIIILRRKISGDPSKTWYEFSDIGVVEPWEVSKDHFFNFWNTFPPFHDLTLRMENAMRLTNTLSPWMIYSGYAPLHCIKDLGDACFLGTNNVLVLWNLVQGYFEFSLTISYRPGTSPARVPDSFIQRCRSEICHPRGSAGNQRFFYQLPVVIAFDAVACKVIGYLSGTTFSR